MAQIIYLQHIIMIIVSYMLHIIIVSIVRQKIEKIDHDFISIFEISNKIYPEDKEKDYRMCKLAQQIIFLMLLTDKLTDNISLLRIKTTNFQYNLRFRQCAMFENCF